jgi:hypothetical protein
MKKKIVGIFVIMLMISSAMTTILFSDNLKVEASGGEPQGGGMNLDYEFVWNMTNQFGQVNNKTDWSGENNIPKGRSWATAGENYTIERILKEYMFGENNTCGVTGYKLLPIGYISGINGLEPWKPFKPKQYSSKIVIHNYSLVILNRTNLYQDVPYSELFPLGVGFIPFWENFDTYLNQNFTFANAEIEEKDLYISDFLEDHFNVSCVQQNTYENLVSPVVYLNTTDSVPENHDCIFILKEERASEEKLEELSDAMGCILIEDESKGYNFDNSGQYNFAIANVSENDNNFSIVLSEIKNGSIYVVDNTLNSEILVFSNYSNVTCCSPSNRVFVVQLDEKDLIQVYLKSYIWSPLCKAIIMWSNQSDYTHIMTHTVRDWRWFNGIYSNRYAIPVFSVNNETGRYLIDHIQHTLVNGFLNQEYRKQNDTTPGVISNNVVAYRNITNSPNNAITVISNRMDGWWGETPADSGVGGAILLGIAKYFKDNNITPKYNLAFLFTTGEEYGMRGAQHYVDSHPRGTGQNEYNFVQWIGFDQLGFNYSVGSGKHCLNLTTNNKNNGMTNDTTEEVLIALGQQTDYEERTSGQYNFDTKDEVKFGAEDFVWDQTGVNTILIEKAENWSGHHQVGNNYQNGDSLANIDRNDVNVTFELAWNITKYFTVNPDCHFHTVSYEATSARGGVALDSITATFDVKSILPSDLVMINASFYSTSSEEPLENIKMNFTANRTGVEQNILFTMPSGVKEGDYYVTLEVYNSTARINIIAGLYNKTNDTDASPTFHLNQYRTLGDIRIGTVTADTHNIIRGSKYTITEDAIVQNITAYVYGSSSNHPTYQCMIYRISDGNRMGYSNPVTCYQTGWVMFTFATKPMLEDDTQYMLTIWGNENAIVYSTPISINNGYCNTNYIFNSTSPPPTIQWDLNSSSLQQFSLFCWYTLNAPQISSVTASPHTVGFGYNVTISADVTAPSGVNYVKAQIISPGPARG